MPSTVLVSMSPVFFPCIFFIFSLKFSNSCCICLPSITYLCHNCYVLDHLFVILWGYFLIAAFFGTHFPANICIIACSFCSPRPPFYSKSSFSTQESTTQLLSALLLTGRSVASFCHAAPCAYRSIANPLSLPLPRVLPLDSGTTAASPSTATTPASSPTSCGSASSNYRHGYRPSPPNSGYKLLTGNSCNNGRLLI